MRSLAPQQILHPVPIPVTPLPVLLQGPDFYLPYPLTGNAQLLGYGFQGYSAIAEPELKTLAPLSGF